MRRRRAPLFILAAVFAVLLTLRLYPDGRERLRLAYSLSVSRVPPLTRAKLTRANETLLRSARAAPSASATASARPEPPYISSRLRTTTDGALLHSLRAACGDLNDTAHDVLRLSTLSLSRLRVIAMSRLMNEAKQSSVFPADFPRFPDGSESPSIDGDPRFSVNGNVLALDFGIVITPYYFTHGAWDALVSKRLLCAFAGDGSADEAVAEGDDAGPGKRAGREAQKIEWDFDTLLAPPGGITLSPDVDLSALSAGLVSDELARALSESSQGARPPELSEDYTPSTWRGALVEAVLSSEEGGGYASARAGAGAPIDWVTTTAALRAAALRLHAAAFDAISPTFATFAQPDMARLHFNASLRPSKAHWLADAFMRRDWPRFKSGLGAPTVQHSSSLPQMLTAFNVVANDRSDVYSDAPEKRLSWGGSLVRNETGMPPTSAFVVSGCVLPGKPERDPPKEDLREVFGLSVRYGDGFFHFVEGLSMAFPFAEWLRVNVGGVNNINNSAHSAYMALWVARSRDYDAFLDLFRFPWRHGPRAHAGKMRAVHAEIFHMSDKGLCQDFKQANVIMGRDVARLTLGQLPGGLAAIRDGPAPPPPLPLVARDAHENGGDGDTAAVAAGARTGAASRTPIVVLIRRRTPYRALTNHDDLTAALLQLPVLLYVFDTASNSSAAHTARAIAEADVLIGSHGAGLAHSFLMRANATIIEIQPEDGPGCVCFLRLAMLAQQSYVNFLPPGSAGGDGGPFNVDAAAVRKAVLSAVAA